MLSVACGPVCAERRKSITALALLMASTVQVARAADEDPCGIESAMAFEEWQEWTATMPKPVFSSIHGDNWVSIYIDDLVRATDLADTGRYAECAKIVKVHFTGASSTGVKRLMLMVKMPAGFDPDNGNWWYAMYDATIGTSVIEQGVVENCIRCHKNAAATDYIFSKEKIVEAAR